ncbi:MAG TPA: GntR family transcriptional regulator [Anaerolineae bacterium]|nr:GntR family transcriptional regulator [Anaerolineae bacterium]
MTTLNKTEGVALYVQVREILRDQIKTGVLKPGQKLPAEDELATQFGVSRMTVRQGISDLSDEGVLYRRRGIGTFVTQFHVERDHNRLTDFLETARAEGFEAEVRLLSREVVPAKLMVAKALALQETEPVIRIQTLRLANDVPMTIYDEYVPYKMCPELLTEDLRSRPAWQILETYGYVIKRAVQRIEARAADEDVASVLNIEEGAPILFKNRIISAEDGTPVELILCHNRGDSYSAKMILVR